MSAAGTDDVVIVGGGPAGLMLACELRLAGVSVTVIEQRPERTGFTKALALHARTVELLAMRGLAGPMLEQGLRVPVWHFGFLEQRVDFTVIDSPYPFVLSFPQAEVEALLEDRALELGARIVRGTTVTGVSADGRVATDEGVWEASWVAGCDGAGSVTRQAVGIDFDGIEARFFSFLGDVRADDPPPPGFNLVNGNGAMMVAPMPGGYHRIAGYDPEHQLPGRREITLDELRDVCVRIAGRDFGIHDPRWLSRFGNTTKVATEYRRGRILLAGDAAHMHFPAGGVGLNLGVQDALNLGWKLAAVIQGRAGESLLDTYDAERRPWGEDVARHTMAQTALITSTNPEGLALRGLMNELLAGLPELSLRLARRLSALDVRYPALGGHPAVGERVTEIDLADGKPVLVTGSAAPKGTAAAIIRPDGYVWWASDSADVDPEAVFAHLPARF